MAGISIVVCCHNSAARLPATIAHLANQEVPPEIAWEVLVVDNASCDDTQVVAQAAWVRHNSPCELKVISEARLGLSYARMAGVESARYEYVLFCDDDNWLDRDYVARAVAVISTRAEIGALGGRTECVADVEVPYWYSTFQGNYAVGVQALGSGDVTSRGYLWGGGMVIRKDVLQCMRVAGFESRLSDRKGALLTSGGDSEICTWFVICGYKLWYDEALKLRHYMPAERLTRDYYCRLRDGLESSRRTLLKYRSIVVRMSDPDRGWLQVLKLGVLAGVYFLLNEKARLEEARVILQITFGPRWTFERFTRELLVCRAKFDLLRPGFHG